MCNDEPKISKAGKEFGEKQAKQNAISTKQNTLTSTAYLQWDLWLKRYPRHLLWTGRGSSSEFPLCERNYLDI